MFLHKNEKVNSIPENGHCFVVLKSMPYEQNPWKTGDRIMRMETIKQGEDPFFFFYTFNDSDSALDKALAKAFLNLLINGDENIPRSVSLFDFHEKLDANKTNTIFTEKEIYGILHQSFLSKWTDHSLLSTYNRRYSAEFNTSSDSLQTLLKRASTEYAGKDVSTDENTKNITKQLKQLLVGLHIDIKNDKTNEWIRIKTLEFNHEPFYRKFIR